MNYERIYNRYRELYGATMCAWADCGQSAWKEMFDRAEKVCRELLMKRYPPITDLVLRYELYEQRGVGKFSSWSELSESTRESWKCFFQAVTEEMGISPRKETQVVANAECTCSYFQVVNFGCPKMRGEGSCK